MWLRQFVFTFFICLLVLFPTLLFSQDSTKIFGGTPISVKSLKEISGKEVKQGDQLDFVVAEDVMVNDKVVIKEGWKVIGTVTEAARSKGLGKKGKLEFSIDYLYTPGGKPIKLRNTVEQNTKSTGGAVAAAAVLVTPWALFIKGKQAKFEAGTVFKAYVNQDVTL